MPVLNISSIVFATLLTGGSFEGNSYADNVERWVKMLRCQGIQDNQIVIIMSEDIDPRTNAQFLSLGPIIRRVPTLSAKNVGYVRYRQTITKIWLWSFEQWKRIIYYDSDVFFLKNPLECLAICPTAAPLCAVSDPDAKSGNYNYFNSGFMVLSPNRTLFLQLWKAARSSVYRLFGDQDLLNDIFISWFHMPRKCNILHAPDVYANVASTPNNVIAVHEKINHFSKLVPIHHPLRSCIDLN